MSGVDVTKGELVAQVAAWITDADRVVAFTGAGVSTASGLPDFRGPEGLWTKDPSAERLSSIDAYLTDAEVRRLAWQGRARQLHADVRPNVAHEALAAMERRGQLHTIITQNVDGLHQAAGSSADRVVEVHGTIHEVVCLSCGERGPVGPVMQRLADGDPDPRCEACGGLLKSATISFGQSLDPAVLQRAHDAVMGCDVLLALGSSLVVHPVALLPRTALEVGAKLVVVNGERTPYDDAAHAALHGDVGEVLTELVARLPAP